MKDLVLHPQTRDRLKLFMTKPSHAVMLVGPAGSGKWTVATSLAEEILRIPPGSFSSHPYGLVIAPEPGKAAIGIDAVRSLEQFLALKVPSQAIFDRAVIIKNAQELTLEAQNALLKTLEEPPAGTILILTANHLNAVLPTIRSRVQTITLGRVKRSLIESHFTDQSFDQVAVARAYDLSGGLPGLMRAIISDEEHPLTLATQKARVLLSQSAYERLTGVDELSKQRGLAMDVCFILQQMAHVSLQSTRGPASKRWQAILKAAYETAEALSGSAQPKLALTKLMLSL